MKLVTSLCQSFLRLVLTTGVITLLAGSPDAQVAPKADFIVQAKTVSEAAELVADYGGEISANLDVIGAVAATMPVGSVNLASRDPRARAVWQDSTVSLADAEQHEPVPTSDYPDVVGADFAWEQGAKGEGITVAIVDTGLSRHPGLVKNIQGQGENRIIGWADFVDGKHAPTDPNGHGTHIAGIIANSQVGPDGEWNGIAPGVRLVGVRVLDELGAGTYSQVIQGIEWVITHKDELNIRVLNLSLVSNVQSPYWADPLNQAVMAAWAEGITVVVAAGNGGPHAMTIGVPGNNPYVITVGAFTDNYTPADWNDDYITPFSAAGPTLDGFAKPDVVAPGAHMASSMPGKSYIDEHHEANRLSQKYFTMAGTSQAAAVVSGIAALTLSHNPDLTPDQVKYRLTQTAFPWIDLETTDALYSMWQQGAGRANAPDAVFADVDGSSNYGLNVQFDLSGQEHYEGFSDYDPVSDTFRLRGDFDGWGGGYWDWDGIYEERSGGYGAWAGGYGAWAGGYGAWAGGYGAWAGGYGAWAGGYGAWAGGYGAWAGGYGAWAGGNGAWAGSYGEASFAEKFFTWKEGDGSWAASIPWSGNWINFDG